MQQVISALSLLIVLLSCQSQKEVSFSEDKLPVIDLNGPNLNDFDFNELVQDIQYLPLETKEGNVVGEVRKIFKTEDYIFITDREQNIFIFSASGKYINSFNEKGKGPEEYLSVSDLLYDENEKQILILTGGKPKKLIYYDLNGNYIDSKSFDLRGMDFTFLSNNKAVLYVPTKMNETNPLLNTLALVTLNEGDDNDFLSTNYETGFPEKSPWLVAGNLSRSFENELIYKEPFNDTIYQVQNDSVLTPRLVIDAGDREEKPSDYVTMEAYRSMEGKKILWFVPYFLENYYCITFHEDNQDVVVIYDKIAGKTYISSGEGGIINKAEGENLYILPKAIGSANELIDFYYPHQIKSADLNPEGKLQKLAESLKDDDNPVLVFVMLKGN